MYDALSYLGPALAAQLFAVVLIYLLVARKRMTAGYRLYAVFLTTIILLLAGRTVQYFIPHPANWYVNCLRVGLFMAVGIPAMFIVSARQTGWRASRRLYVAPFAIGLVFAASYIFFQDARQELGLFPVSFVSALPFQTRKALVDSVWLVAALATLAWPNMAFMLIEWRGKRNRTHLSFMGGAALFGLLLAVGAWTRWYRLYYLFSMLSALLWAWGMFLHVRQMKGRVGLLKEELEGLVQAGAIWQDADIEVKLAELDEGDISVYKLRMREILTTLTDATIRAGGDSKALIERTEAREAQIAQSNDPKQMREVLRAEAVGLSEIICEIERQEPVTVRRARELMGRELGRDLSVDGMAEELGVSRSYLMREFKKTTGRTVNQYLTALRIEKAKELLPLRTVTETAFEVGYNHANYFSTVFKKQTGSTPLEYQRAHPCRD